MALFRGTTLLLNGYFFCLATFRGTTSLLKFNGHFFCLDMFRGALLLNSFALAGNFRVLMDENSFQVVMDYLLVNL